MPVGDNAQADAARGFAKRQSAKKKLPTAGKVALGTGAALALLALL